MSQLDLSRWYYPPGRPVEEGRVFSDPSQAPHGWSVDPSPPKDGTEPEPVISAADFEAAVSTAQSLSERLAEADARIADLESALAAAKPAKAKGKAADPAATETPADGK